MAASQQDELEDVLTDDAFDAEKQFLASVKAIRLEKKSLYDRLRSVVEDSCFVERVTKHYKVPLVCNERCGRWYCPDPSSIAASAYFKSTDGHMHQWGFSMRRLNLHLLKLIVQHGSIMIVDSTRRGKRMPDALSKTIPIWAAVLNRCRFLVDKLDAFDVELQTPEVMVSDSENDMIASQIDGWAHSLLETGVDLALLRQLDKPLRPLWVTQADPFPDLSTDAYNMILVTASKCVPDGIERVFGYTYHQGGADDEELWSQKLSPAAFWQHKEDILRDRDTVQDAIRVVVAQPQMTQQTLELAAVGQTLLSIGVGSDEALVNSLEDSLIITAFESTGSLVQGSFDTSKTGIAELSKLFARLESCLEESKRWQHKLVIIDNEACKSKAPILALLILCKYYSLEGQPLDRPRMTFSKDLVRKHLVTLVNSRPGINPPRKFLQALNTHLMSDDYHR